MNVRCVCDRLLVFVKGRCLGDYRSIAMCIKEKRKRTILFSRDTTSNAAQHDCELILL